MNATLDPNFLKYQVRLALGKAKARLAKHCNFDPFAWVIHPDHRVETAPLYGPLMTDARAKDALFEVLGQYCEKKQAPGLILVTDSWGLEYSPEQERIRST